MTRYEVFATRWDDPHVVDQIPATGVQFTLPLSDHGVCSFTATVHPFSTWRAATSVGMSGVLVTSDTVPVWCGVLDTESQSGPRTFDFQAKEWGHFFTTCEGIPARYTQTNDHDIFRNIILNGERVPGQNIGLLTGSTEGGSVSDLTINGWDFTTVEEEFRRVGEHAGGPEWYFSATGTLDQPTRTLVLGDRLGSTTPTVVLEYVENTDDTPLGQPPNPQAPGRRGGNVLNHPARQVTNGVTSAVAVGAGQEVAQIRATATADNLLAAGYPRRIKITSYNDVSIQRTIQRHAAADLAAALGMTTAYTLATFDDDPDWTQVARGDTVTVSLDTDVYATTRPLVFNTRVLSIAVSVPDAGRAQVTYTCATVQDY